MKNSVTPSSTATARSADTVDHARRAFACGLVCAPVLARAGAMAVAHAQQVPIHVFHRFAATALDSMTLRTVNFESQLRMLEDLSCHLISLAEWVAWRLAQADGRPASLPPRAVVLTADDGHRSQFEVMAPMLRARGWPVTLFVYPSAISNAGYAMTWPQLRELSDAAPFSVQSHTYWHPNLLRERAQQSPEAFHRFAAEQLRRSRETIEQRLGKPASLLAWPFGLSDAGLTAQAAEAGYQSAFSLGNRSAAPSDPPYAVPRHLIVDSVDARQLAARLKAAFDSGVPS